MVGGDSNNVVIISPDGQRHRQVLSSEDGLVKPRVLDYDNVDKAVCKYFNVNCRKTKALDIFFASSRYQRSYWSWVGGPILIVMIVVLLEKKRSLTLFKGYFRNMPFSLSIDVKTILL
jgi:hypothetical protein